MKPVAANLATADNATRAVENGPTSATIRRRSSAAGRAALRPFQLRSYRAEADYSRMLNVRIRAYLSLTGSQATDERFEDQAARTAEARSF
jgi:hypothetical protein